MNKRKNDDPARKRAGWSRHSSIMQEKNELISTYIITYPISINVLGLSRSYG